MIRKLNEVLNIPLKFYFRSIELIIVITLLKYFNCQSCLTKGRYVVNSNPGDALYLQETACEQNNKVI